MGKAGNRARKILKERKIDIEDMRRYRLGYASPGALVGALAGYPPSLRKAAEEAGLFIMGKDGRPRELQGDERQGEFLNPGRDQDRKHSLTYQI
jgi:DNA primase